MNKEELIRNLKYTEKKHRHDTVNTFDTDISMMCSDVLRVLKNCIEIPEGATNGDMIKAMFPNIDASVSGDGDVIDVYNLGIYCQTFDTEWWNSPYKREVEK